MNCMSEYMRYVVNMSTRKTICFNLLKTWNSMLKASKIDGSINLLMKNEVWLKEIKNYYMTITKERIVFIAHSLYTTFKIK